MAKTQEEKRRRALERTRNSKWENSKAFRTGSMTKAQWEERREALLRGL
jgi:hypothetical protein